MQAHNVDRSIAIQASINTLHLHKKICAKHARPFNFQRKMRPNYTCKILSLTLKDSKATILSIANSMTLSDVGLK